MQPTTAAVGTSFSTRLPTQSSGRVTEKRTHVDPTEDRDRANPAERRSTEKSVHFLQPTKTQTVSEELKRITAETYLHPAMTAVTFGEKCKLQRIVATDTKNAKFGEKYESKKIIAMDNITNEAPEALTYTGQYHRNRGEFDKAVEFFRYAASKNFLPALGCLGDMYRMGWGFTKPDIHQACCYYQEAARLGDVDSFTFLKKLSQQDGTDKKIFKQYHSELVQLLVLSEDQAKGTE